MAPPIPPSPPPAAPAARRWRFGPAGWSYTDWRGVVYLEPAPPGFRPVPFLAELFDTIEVNVTFYRDVPAVQLERWCAQVADRPDFRWCFKLHQRFSHGGGVPAPRDLLPALASYAPVREADRLGALLLQFPWSLRGTPTHRTQIADLLSAARDAGWPLVVEVRHRNWGEGTPAFPPVICDQPDLPGNLGCDTALAAAAAVAGTGAGPLYIRLHGRNRTAWFDREAGRDRRYDYLYTPQERAGWLERLRRLARDAPAGVAAFLIANNHFRGQAVVDALVLQEMWSGRRPPLPASLKRAYPRELAAFPAAPTAAGRRRREPPPTLF